MRNIFAGGWEKAKLVEVRSLDLPEVLEITPKKFGDHRGFFSETYNRQAFADAGIKLDFVQDNHSFSAARGTLRGLHFQNPPMAQDKLIRVTHGEIFDVAVDVRKGSPNFGKWVAIVLSEKKWNQLLVPAGFAHGFVTLVPDTEVLYKTSGYYSPLHDRSIRFDDPEIAISWPAMETELQLSDKDRNAGFLADTDTGFVYQETGK